MAPLSMGEDDFVAWTAARTTPQPPNKGTIVRANQGRSTRPLDHLRQVEICPNRCAA
jgi:hypothetical protein